jgi:hypothetical protein
VRRELANADLGSKLFDNVPYEFFRHPFAPDFASTTHTAEEAASGDSSGLRPLVQEILHPSRNRDGSNVPSFPRKVYDCPMSFALLKMTYRRPGEFVATEPTGKKHRKQGPFRPLLRFEHSARPFPERSGESPQEMAVGEPVRRPGTCRLNPNLEDLYQALAVDSCGVKQPHWAYFAPWPRSISDSDLVSFGI